MAARELLRGKPRVDLHRKELAITAGVTPALVSYYFQDQGSLIEAVVKPVIDEYLDRLKALLTSDGPLLLRLRSLILFLLRLSHLDGQLIETYVNHVKRQRKSMKTEFLVKAQRELMTFFADCQQARLVVSSNIAFTIAALWGMCRTIADTPELFVDIPRTSLDDGVVETLQTDLILDMLTSGKLSAA